MAGQRKRYGRLARKASTTWLDIESPEKESWRGEELCSSEYQSPVPRSNHHTWSRTPSVGGQARVGVASRSRLGLRLRSLASANAAALKLQLADEITTQSSGRGGRAGGSGRLRRGGRGREPFLSPPIYLLSSSSSFVLLSVLRFKLDVVDIKTRYIHPPCEAVPPQTKRNGLAELRDSRTGGRTRTTYVRRLVAWLLGL